MAKPLGQCFNQPAVKVFFRNYYLMDAELLGGAARHAVEADAKKKGKDNPMSQIKIEKLNEDQKKALNIPDQPENTSEWSIWECHPSTFDWHYDETEECYLLKGRVVVETKDGNVEFGAGDFVTFPKGLSCVWDIKEPVRKHYNFK